MTSSREDALENPQQKIEATDGATIQHIIQAVVGSPTDSINIGPTYTRSKQEELSDYLARAVAIYKGRLYQAITQFSRFSSPYKLLSSFRIEDASIFCGRTSATEDLCKKVFQARLLTLHAKSGAGKTSLLNAGLSPYVIRQGRLPLYIHTYDKDPVWVIKQTLVSAALGSWPDRLHDLSLHDFLAQVCDCLKRDNVQELIIILDQFEDFFLYWTQPHERLPFIKALGDCYSDQTLPIRIIIALRKDYYSDLTEFEEVLPHLRIFQNHYRPSAMTQQEVKEAIIQPLKELNSAVTYDSALLDTLVAELSRDEIELPLLQIICTRLYETLAKDKKKITLKMYEVLGKAEGVLKSYLNEVLAGLPEKEKVLAKSVLKEFVRSDLTKQTLSENKLITRVEAKRIELDHILAQLVNARLLYRDDIEGETRYELVHEYLTTEIVKWIDVADRDFKRAEELLKSELAIWRSYRDLISLERLELLYPYRERFKGLDAEEWECLLRSAIKAEADIGDEYPGTDVTDWVKAVRDIDATLLCKAIVEPLIAELQNHENDRIRYDAANGLAMIGEDGDVRAVEPLIAALQDKDEHVRINAAEALGKLGDMRAFEPLIVKLQDEDSGLRRWAAWGLGELGDVRALEPLIAALQDKDSTVRIGPVRALGMFGDVRAVEPLIIALKDRAVRREAAEALGKIGGVRAVETLITVLQDEDSTMRREAARALGELGDVRAVEPLIVALQDKDRTVRREAAGALGVIGDMHAVESLIMVLQSKDSYVLDCVAWALGKIGDVRAVESLIIALQDKDSDVREYAAWSLGEIRNVRAVEPLIIALQDKNRAVRREATEALEKIGDVRVISP